VVTSATSSVARPSAIVGVGLISLPHGELVTLRVRHARILTRYWHCTISPRGRFAEANVSESFGCSDDVQRVQKSPSERRGLPLHSAVVVLDRRHQCNCIGPWDCSFAFSQSERRPPHAHRIVPQSRLRVPRRVGRRDSGRARSRTSPQRARRDALPFTRPRTPTRRRVQ
jgi:hypothetical protein